MGGATIRWSTQDLTEIGSYLLKKEGIDHATMMGFVQKQGVEKAELRYWIELDNGCIIDFRSGEPPIFTEDQKQSRYSGEETKVMANSVRFEALTGETP